MDDSEVDEFFEGVAGNRAPGPTPPAAHQLGVAVRSAVLRRRGASGEALSDGESQQRDALLDGLEARGLFGDPQASTVTPLRRSGKRPWTRWGRPLALAAALGVCAVGVLQFLPASHVPGGWVERGALPLTLHSADPAATTHDLAQELSQTGATVQSVQINDTSWTLSIEFPRTASGALQNDVRDKVGVVLAAHGIKVAETDSFTILIDSAAQP